MSMNKREAIPAGADVSRFAVAAAIVVAAFVSSPASQAAESAAGLRIAKDPVTGQLRAPTAAESAALDAASSAKARQPRGLITGKINPAPVLHPNGTVEQELDESTLSFSMATRNPDGSVGLQCVTGPEAATAVLNGTKVQGKNAKVAKSAKEHSHDQK